VVFWHEASATVFSGDLLVAGGTVVIPASDGGSLVEYLRSLRRVAALGPRRALPAHGDPIHEPLALIDQYLAHRLRRETQVVDALAAGVSRVGDIVSRIYLGLAPSLVPQARESVLAHLQKLEDDGVVAREGGQWRRC
jgi:glyoxylase-like metal-dependent hydrolase (beta-lactamase superfamily II)